MGCSKIGSNSQPLLISLLLLLCVFSVVGQHSQQQHVCPQESQHNVDLLLSKRFDILMHQEEHFLTSLLDSSNAALWSQDVLALQKRNARRKGTQDGIEDVGWSLKEFKARFVSYYGGKLCLGLFGNVPEEKPHGWARTPKVWALYIAMCFGGEKK